MRAAGSMDTTIIDIAKFAACYIRGDGLRPARRAALVRLQLLIKTLTQFPTLQAEQATEPFAAISSALGVVAFHGPQGAAFFKGGHNDTTANTWVCVEASKRCVVLLSNDVRAEAAFPAIVRSIFGETGVPWRWEYGDVPFWSSNN